MPDSRGGLSVVTVVFEAEVPLLVLQARSIARHVPDGVFDEVLVIDNSRQGLSPDGAATYPHRTRRPRRAHRLRNARRPRRRGLVGDGMAHAAELEAHGCATAHGGSLRRARRQEPLHRADDAGGLLRREDGPPPRRDPLLRAASAARAGLERVASGLGLDPAVTVERFTATAPPVVLDRRRGGRTGRRRGPRRPRPVPGRVRTRGLHRVLPLLRLADREGRDARRPGIGAFPREPDRVGRRVRPGRRACGARPRRAQRHDDARGASSGAREAEPGERAETCAEFWTGHDLFDDDRRRRVVRPSIPGRLRPVHGGASSARADYTAHRATRAPSDLALRSTLPPQEPQIVRSSPRSLRTMGTPRRRRTRRPSPARSREPGTTGPTAP